MTLYIVMPEQFQTTGMLAPWLRTLINCAEWSCPTIIDTSDRDKELAQQDRILFMLDEFPALGRLSAFENGLSETTLQRGITYWGLAQFDSDIVKTYGARTCGGIHNNACVQYLDTNPSNERILTLAIDAIKANPPRPHTLPRTTPYDRPRNG